MLQNYLLIALRSLKKNKVFVIINLLGMAIAVACCIVAFLNYDYNASYDQEHTNKDEIYRINGRRVFNEQETLYGIVPIPLGPSLRENLSDSRIVSMAMNFENLKFEEDIFTAQITYAEDGFFDMFTFPLLSGSIDLNDKSTIVIDDKLATRLFGNEDPIGKTFTSLGLERNIDYRITGVFQSKPINSSFTAVEAVTSFENFFDILPNTKPDDWKIWSTAFIQIKDPTQIPSIERELSKFIPSQNASREDLQFEKFYLDPLPGMAARAEANSTRSNMLNQGLPGAAVLAPLIMAGFLLLLACFNFTNTSIATSGKRLKEIGLRKVMGGVRSQLVFQFLTENILMCFFAIILGLIIAEFLVPAYSNMWEFLNIELVYSENFMLILFLVALLFIIGIFAGAYPAFYVSKFEPTSILKRTDKFGSTGNLSKILLVLQFSIALLAIIHAIAFVQNAKYQQNLDLGFETDGLIYVSFENANDLEIYKNSISGNEEIINISRTPHQVAVAYINDPVKYESTEIESDIIHVDDQYIATMGVSILDGRNFKKDSKTDQEESIIVNETLIDQLGWEDPIGKRIVWRDTVQLYVVGVIKDLYVRSLWEKKEPMMFRLSKKEDDRYLTVASTIENTASTNDFLEKKWKDLFPSKLYNGRLLNEQFLGPYLVNKNIVNMFSFLGIVAAILAFSGLYSLVSLNIIKRMKEIAVRKVLGATILHVSIKMNKPFIIILFISGIIGSVGSYFMVTGLMSSIWAYHVDINISLFIVSAVIMLFASIITVGYKVYNAANSNPASTLRNE